MPITGKDTRTLKQGDAEPPYSPGVVRIITMRFCPFGERTLIYCARKGIPAEIINFSTVSKPEWLLTKNPKGTAPTLQLDDMNLYESAIVCEYLDEQYPENPVLPKDPYLKAHQKILAQNLSVVPGAVLKLTLAMKKGSLPEVEAAVTEFEKQFDYAEGLLKESGAFFGGSSPGFADYMVFTHVERAWAHLTRVAASVNKDFAPLVDKFKTPDFPGVSRWPKLSLWFATMLRQPEIIEGSQPIENLAAFLETYVAGEPNFDVNI